MQNSALELAHSTDFSEVGITVDLKIQYLNPIFRRSQVERLTKMMVQHLRNTVMKDLGGTLLITWLYRFGDSPFLRIITKNNEICQIMRNDPLFFSLCFQTFDR